MTFRIDLKDLTPKRSRIKVQMENAFIAQFGDIDLDLQSVFGKSSAFFPSVCRHLGKHGRMSI